MRDRSDRSRYRRGSSRSPASGALRLDDDAVDAADEPGAGGRPGHHYVDRAETEDGERVPPGRGPVAAYAKELDRAPTGEAATRSGGRELAGVRYRPLWDYFADTEKWGTENAWQILAADYVATGEGTGIVHKAPAYGEDDQASAQAAGIPVVISVDDGAKFLPIVAMSPVSRCSRRTSR